MKLWSIVAVMAFCVNVASAQPQISSVSIGLYDPDERSELAPGFINAVNADLHRYEPSCDGADCATGRGAIGYAGHPL
jgi:hypothetical protein